MPTCTDPNLNAPYDSAVPSPLATTKRYPTRRGHDQIFGYGRVNMNRAVDALVRTGDAAMPPEVEITSPDWYDQVDPGRASFDAARPDLRAWRRLHLPGLRGARLTAEQRCRHRLVAGRLQARAVLVVQRRRPHERLRRSARRRRRAAAAVRCSPPARATSTAASPVSGAQTSNGRPNTEPYGFTVKVVAQLDAERGRPAGRGPAQHVPAPRPGHAAGLPEGPRRRAR